jgi:hypothetical protein
MSTMGRVFSMLLALVMLAGCASTMGGTVITGSGRTTTQKYDLSGFNKVNAGSAFKVAIDRGESYGVSVTIDDNLVEYLDVRVEGDTLHVGLKPGASLGFRNTTQRAEITMPGIEGIELSGATQGVVAGFDSEKRLEIEVSGASRLRGDMTAGDMWMQVSGASTVELDGGGADLDVEASGASSVRLDNFEVQDARVNASGASNITVNASGRVTGSASGASTVKYVGDPESVRVDSSGASNVRQK